MPEVETGYEKVKKRIENEQPFFEVLKWKEFYAIISKFILPGFRRITIIDNDDNPINVEIKQEFAIIDLLQLNVH